MRYGLAFCVGYFLLFASSITAHAETVIFDGNFAPADWTNTVVIGDNPGIGGTGPGTSTGSVTRQTSGGNLGAFQQSTLNLVVGDVVFTYGLLTGFTHDPATAGAILDLNFSLDLTNTSATVGGNSGWQLILEQDGNTYYSTPAQFFPVFSDWTTYTLPGLTQADFDTDWTAPAGTNQPDFSSAGSPIRFGYTIWAGVNGGTAVLVNGADNFSLRINAVPEPSSIVIGSCAGLAGLALCLRRRRA